MIPDGDDEELLAGDASAYAAFYRRHEDALLGFFLRRVGGAPELAADLTAECFARALAGRASFDPARGEARGWLFGIARHLLARSLERGRVEDDVRRRLEMEPLALDDAALDRIHELDGEPALAGLNGLPEEQRAAVAGRVLEEASYADLAERLQCSESLVRQRVSRGLRVLRSGMGERT